MHNQSAMHESPINNDDDMYAMIAACFHAIAMQNLWVNDAASVTLWLLFYGPLACMCGRLNKKICIYMNWGKLECTGERLHD